MEENPAADRARAAISWSGGNDEHHFKPARALMTERDQRMALPNPDHEGRKKSHDPIIAALQRAISLNPLNLEYNIRLAWEYLD